jgi:hypothetical protein
MCIQLWEAVWPLPGILQQVTDLVCHQIEPNPGLAMELCLRVYTIRDTLRQWYKKWRDNLFSLSILSSWRDLSRELLGFLLSAQIVVNRTIVSISPGKSADVEKETQQLADCVLGITQETNCEHGTRCPRFYQRLNKADSSLRPKMECAATCRNLIAKVAIDTRKEWEEVSSTQNELLFRGSGEHICTRYYASSKRQRSRTVVDKWIFERWCHLMGRKTSA